MNVAKQAADVLLHGGVIAYPTEGVFGLGCLPTDRGAVARILEIKRRDSSKGLILIAASNAQLAGWVNLPANTVLPTVKADNPVTWLVPPGPLVEPIVQGNNPGVAVRLTKHAIAQSICNLLNTPLISTSANLSGQPTARNRYVLRRQFGHRVDYIVPGACGPVTGPSEIRNLLSGEIVRPLPS